jgi:hypothetical protein
MTDPKNPLAANLAADVLALAGKLREFGQSPAGRSLLRGLEKALPEATAEVRAAAADPMATIGSLLEHATRPARGDLADSDRAIARGIARALGRGFARGTKKGHGP